MSADGRSAFDDDKARAVWKERAEKYGARSVINLNYTPAHFATITAQQKEILLPQLRSRLTGTERTILDFGCGPGRFTTDLANLLPGMRAVGFDISQELVDMAPKAANVRYTAAVDDLTAPALKGYFDVIWVCLVLGGIPDPRCGEIVAQLMTTLAPGGLVFLVEHVSDTKTGSDFWKFRTLDAYQAMCAAVPLAKVGAYLDMGEEVAIMAGRAA